MQTGGSMRYKNKIPVFILVLLAIGAMLISFILLKERSEKILFNDISSYIKETLGNYMDAEGTSIDGTDEIKSETLSHEVNDIILSLVKVEVLGFNKKKCILRVTSPDCALIYDNILNNLNEWANNDFVASKNYIFNKLIGELKSKSLVYVATEVELEVVKNGDRYEVVETEEYLDALYGGLYTYYKYLSERLELQEGRYKP